MVFHGISGKGKDYSSPVPVDEGSSQANANLEDPHDVNMEIPLSSEATTASHVISAESPPANVQDGGSVVEGEVCETYVVTLPRSLHFEPKVIKAKHEELKKFQDFDAYEIVEAPSNDKILGTNWVVTEKEKDGESFTKARLCVRGDQEVDKNHIATDSPTVAKYNIRMMLMAAEKEGWNVRASDVTSAFLQSGGIYRDVYVRPPKESGVEKGKVWRLRKTVYGLLDASRGFYLSYSNALGNLGMEVSRLDPALFLFFDDKSTRMSKERKLSGIRSTHVDDSLTIDSWQRLIQKSS